MPFSNEKRQFMNEFPDILLMASFHYNSLDPVSELPPSHLASSFSLQLLEAPGNKTRSTVKTERKKKYFMACNCLFSYFSFFFFFPCNFLSYILLRVLFFLFTHCSCEVNKLALGTNRQDVWYKYNCFNCAHLYDERYQ